MSGRYRSSPPHPMTAVHLVLILVGYVLKAGVTVVLWRRYGPRVRALGRLGRARKAAGRPVLVRATPGHLARTFRLGPSRAARPLTAV